MDLRDLRPPVDDGPWPPLTHLPPIQAGPVAGATTWTGLTYAQVDGYRPMVLDLHVPASGRPAPVVLYVHGGGWSEGDRRYVPLQWGQVELFERMVAAGLAVATLDYRLIGEAPPEAAVQDLVAAVRYLRAYAGELGLDADRVGVWGDSAGAHLGAVAGLSGSDAAADPELLGDIGVGVGRTDVQALVCWYGASDLTVLPDLWPLLWPDRSDAERAELARQLSPLSLVRSDSPPLLLMHGDRDGVAPLDQSVRLHEAVQRVGGRSELVVVEGADHVFLGADIGPLWQRAIDFLARELALPR